MTQKATLNNGKSALMRISSVDLGQVPPLGLIFLHWERRDLFMRTWSHLGGHLPTLPAPSCMYPFHSKIVCSFYEF